MLFMSEFTKELEGVGDVCVFADFDMRNHGNAKYGKNSCGDCRFMVLML